MKNTALSPSRRSALRLTPLALAMACVLGSAQAALNIPEVPLQAGQVVESNVLFILDNSGSMQWEIMPDNYISGNEYLFPQPTNLYEAGNYSSDYEGFGTTDGNVWRRSPRNMVFYNPAITYRPWVKSDGTTFGNASPSSAQYNPGRSSQPSSHALDLTKRIGSSGSNYPITFHVYKGSGDQTKAVNYIRYQYRDGKLYERDLNKPSNTEKAVTTLSWTGAEGETISRSVDEEVQNFANWFSYYRSRVNTARAAASIAFADLAPDRFRVGFNTLNSNNATNRLDIPVAGVFKDSNRDNWYTKLFRAPINGSTPLRTALKTAGDYFSSNSNTGPWGPAPQIACRRNFAILTSDGYWNDGSPGVGNTDGSGAVTHTSSDGKTFTFSPPERPYSDSHSNTLADVAMHYWKRDLRTDLPNSLRPTTRDPAFWQHMTTFTVSIGLRGSLDPETDFDGLKSGAKSWPDPTSAELNKIDDLWHAAVNGRGEFFVAEDPNKMIEGLRRAIATIGAEGAVMNVALSSTSLEIDGKKYTASFDGTWGGELTAHEFTSSGTGSKLWDASSKLPSHSARKIFTRVGTNGKAFLWSNLNATMKAQLGNDEHLVNYLRGDQSKEMINGGTYRNRSKILGDFVNSEPVYDKKTQTVYIGGNDGMLHAFDAQTGVERFAYIPTGVFAKLKDLAVPEYAHKFFVDGQIAISEDVGGKRILIGSLGRGGRQLFALDVTDPANFAAGDVMWEFTDSDLGVVLGKPLPAKTTSGAVVIVGNGANSDTEKAILLVLDVNSGSLVKKINTGIGSASASNGLGPAASWDDDTDSSIDYVYAGDRLGNLWKFKFNGASGGWAVDNGGNPIFTAKDASAKVQPITGTPAVAEDSKTGKRWVFFGTGSYLTQQDPAIDDVQSIYGIIDDGSTVSGRSQLRQRSFSGYTTQDGRLVRELSKAVEGDMDGRKGWYADLVKPGGGKEGERVIGPARYQGNRMAIASQIPVTDICQPGGRGYINAFDPFTGGRTKKPTFDFDGDGTFDPDTEDYSSVGTDYMISDVPMVDRLTTGPGDDPDEIQTRRIDDPRISWHEVVTE